MAFGELFNATVVGTGTGGTTQTVTVPFSGVTGNNTLAVLRCASRAIGTTFSVSATFDGNVMALAAEASAALAGFGEGSAAIFYFAAGDLVSAAGDAVFTITSSNGLVGRIANLTIYKDSLQVSPLRATNTAVFVSSAVSASTTVTSLASDLVLDCIAKSTVSALTVGAGQTQQANADNGSGNGDAVQIGTSSEIALGASTTMSWSFGSSPFALAAASFIEDAAPGGPVITQVTPSGGAGAVIRPTDTNTLVEGMNFAPAGVTQLIMSPTTGPGDPLAEIQSISSVVGSSLNWDSVNFGSMDPGELVLTVRTDAGGGGEQDSPPFPIVASPPDIHWARLDHTTDGTIGLQTVISGLGFKPVAAFITVTGNTAVDTLQPDVELGQCLVDQSTSMGIGLGAQANPMVVKRKQISGAGALFVLDPNSDAAPDVVVGTPILTDDGMDISWTVNTAGYHIGVVFVGGLTARANLHQIQINDSLVTGLPFAPQLLVGVSSNQGSGATEDTTFARQSFGMAIGPGTAQFNQSTDLDSNSARNTEILQGTFLAQLNGTSNTWAMSITALNSDGYAWSGNNPDIAYVLALNLDTAQMFLTQFASTQSGNGAQEDWPDSGIDTPGVMVATTAARTDTGPIGALGGRWASGVSFPGNAQAGSTSLYLPESGIGTTEQNHSHVNMLSSSSAGGSLTLETRVVDFKRQPRVEYVTNPTPGILYNIFMAEEVSSGDDEGAFSNVW